jgi:hypothetical protein
VATWGRGSRASAWLCLRIDLVSFTRKTSLLLVSTWINGSLFCSQVKPEILGRISISDAYLRYLHIAPVYKNLLSI